MHSGRLKVSQPRPSGKTLEDGPGRLCCGNVQPGWESRGCGEVVAVGQSWLWESHGCGEVVAVGKSWPWESHDWKEIDQGANSGYSEW